MTRERNGESDSAALDRLRRRRIISGILLPFGIALAIVLAFVVAALALPTPTQVSLLSDASLTLLLLFPAAICLFPLVILSLALAALMSRWNRSAQSPLRRLEAWAAALERNADGWLRGIDQRILGWAVAFAPIRQLLRTFDTLESAGDEAADEEEP